MTLNVKAEHQWVYLLFFIALCNSVGVILAPYAAICGGVGILGSVAMLYRIWKNERKIGIRSGLRELSLTPA